MEEATKQLAYLLHDIYGYHEDEEATAAVILRLARRKGWDFVRYSDLTDSYKQGYDDAIQWESDR